MAMLRKIQIVMLLAVFAPYFANAETQGYEGSETEVVDAPPGPPDISGD